MQDGAGLNWRLRSKFGVLPTSFSPQLTQLEEDNIPVNLQGSVCLGALVNVTEDKAPNWDVKTKETCVSCSQPLAPGMAAFSLGKGQPATHASMSSSELLCPEGESIATDFITQMATAKKERLKEKSGVHHTCRCNYVFGCCD